jgi:GT2 family glycosyltransferase
MATNKQLNIAVIVLNWNGEEDSLNCIKALKKQTTLHDIIAVDNASSDNFVSVVRQKYPEIAVLENTDNLGFAGGVNTGIRHAINNDYEFVALINNDATPDPTWLENLLKSANDTKIGIVTGKLLKTAGTIDSTGDLYTSWGLAYPRGRNEADTGKYDLEEEVFGATGGASLYRIEMLKEIGLFDEDFFAYYEDVDLSFRAQLAGWKVIYNPKAVAYHKIGASSGKVPGLTTYMTIKNLPWLMWKNVPWKLMPTIFPRFFIAHMSIVLSSLAKGKFWPVFKGIFVAFWLFPKKLAERHKILKSRKVPVDYIKSIITYDLPPNADKLKKVRSVLKTIRFWR